MKKLTRMYRNKISAIVVVLFLGQLLTFSQLVYGDQNSGNTQSQTVLSGIGLPNQTMLISFPDQSVMTVQADNAGNYAVNISGWAEGTPVTVVAVNADGRKSEPVTAIVPAPTITYQQQPAQAESKPTRENKSVVASTKPIQPEEKVSKKVAQPKAKHKKATQNRHLGVGVAVGIAASVVATAIAYFLAIKKGSFGLMGSAIKITQEQSKLRVKIVSQGPNDDSHLQMLRENQFVYLTEEEVQEILIHGLIAIEQPVTVRTMKVFNKEFESLGFQMEKDDGER
jgi:hypothetical protein